MAETKMAVVLASIREDMGDYSYYNNKQEKYVGKKIEVAVQGSLNPCAGCKTHRSTHVDDCDYEDGCTSWCWKETDIIFTDDPITPKLHKSDLVGGAIVTFFDGSKHVYIPDPSGVTEGMFVNTDEGYTRVTDYNDDLENEGGAGAKLSVKEIKTVSSEWKHDVIETLIKD